MQGRLIFDNEEFFFVLNKEKNYILITQAGDRSLARYKQMFTDPRINVPEFINGKETGQIQDNIIFITNKEGKIVNEGESIKIEIMAYMKFKNFRRDICRIDFRARELNKFYSKNIVTLEKKKIDDEYSNSYKIDNPSNTISDKHQFSHKNNDFNIFYSLSYIQKNSDWDNFSLSTEAVMSLETIKKAEFDFNNLIDLVKIIRDFNSFLFRRKNIGFSKITLHSIYDETHTMETGELFLCGIGEYVAISHNKSIDKYNIIEYDWIFKNLKHLLQLCADKRIFLDHIKDNGRIILDKYDFIISTAAFEWEIDQVYPNNKIVSQGEHDANIKVNQLISELIDQSTSKVKSKLKKIKSELYFYSLEQKIKSFYKLNIDVCKPICDYLYKLNNVEFKLENFGQAITKARNNFAHGNLENVEIENIGLEKIVLDRFVFVLQLKRIGMDNEEIKTVLINTNIVPENIFQKK